MVDLERIDKLLKPVNKKCHICNDELSINSSTYDFKYFPKYVKQWFECIKCKGEFLRFSYFNQELTEIKNQFWYSFIYKTAYEVNYTYNDNRENYCSYCREILIKMI